MKDVKDSFLYSVPFRLFIGLILGLGSYALIMYTIAGRIPFNIFIILPCPALMFIGYHLTKNTDEVVYDYSDFQSGFFSVIFLIIKILGYPFLIALFTVKTLIQLIFRRNNVPDDVDFKESFISLLRYVLAVAFITVCIYFLFDSGMIGGLILSLDVIFYVGFRVIGGKEHYFNVKGKGIFLRLILFFTLFIGGLILLIKGFVRDILDILGIGLSYMTYNDDDSDSDGRVYDKTFTRKRDESKYSGDGMKVLQTKLNEIAEKCDSNAVSNPYVSAEVKFVEITHNGFSVKLNVSVEIHQTIHYLSGQESNIKDATDEYEDNLVDYTYDIWQKVCEKINSMPYKGLNGKWRLTGTVSERVHTYDGKIKHYNLTI